MDVLMAAAELSPYAQATRAGDAVAALSKVLSQNGHDVTVALPRYAGFEAGGLLMARRLTPLKLGDETAVTVLDGQLASGVKIVLFDAPELFERAGVFADETGKDYPDNVHRFGLICRAVAALVDQRAAHGQPFDVVHLYDWPVAPVAALLGAAHGALPTVLTLQDPAAQGSFAHRDAAAAGYPEAVLRLGRVSNRFNCLKTGLAAARVITTPSEAITTALTQTDQYGAVSAAARERDAAEILSIPGGLDYSVYNPATDAAIKSRYHAEDLANKGTCRTHILGRHGLEFGAQRPLLAVLLGDEAGLELFKRARKGLLKSDCSIIVVWLGARGSAKPLPEPEADRLAVVDGLDDPGLRGLAAGADFLACLVRDDPDGWYPKLGQRYGALPIALQTSAAATAVVDCDAQLTTGTGFVASEEPMAGLIAAVQRARAAFVSERWPALQRRVMRLDLSWDRPARRYVQAYRLAARRAAT